MRAAVQRELTPFEKERLTGIGGSDAAAIAGLSRFASAINVWEQKLNIAPAFEGNENTRWGTALEPVIRERFAEEHPEFEVVGAGDFARHPEHDFMIAHYDGLLRHTEEAEVIGVLEIKTAGHRMAKEWGDDGEQKVPESYAIQVQHYLAISGLPMAIIAVLIGGNDYREYVIPRNDELIGNLVDIERNFWTKYVQPQEQPPPDDSEGYRDYLSRTYFQSTDEMAVATAACHDAAIDLARVTAEMKKLEKEKVGLQNTIKDEIKDCAGIVSPTGELLATWKRSEDGQETKWQQTARDLHLMIPDPDRPEWDAFVAGHTKVKPGSRRFLPKLKLNGGSHA